MADKAPPDPVLVTDILRYAIASAGPIDDPAKWRGQLSIMIPEIVAVLGENSNERAQVVAMMNAPVLTGDFVSAKLNDSNHRMLVTIQCAERDPESLWSARTDTPLGAAQLAMIQKIRSGNRVRAWKGLRQISQEKKVRDLLHIQRVDADDPVPSSSPPPADPAPLDGEAAERSGAAPGGSAPEQPSPPPAPPLPKTDIVLDYAGALERLRGDQRVRLARWAHDTMNVSLYDADLTADQKNTILAHCELIAQGMA